MPVNTIQPTIKASDALFNTVENIVRHAKLAGIDLKITDVYTKENLEEIALLSAFTRQLVEKSAKVTIEILNQ